MLLACFQLDHQDSQVLSCKAAFQIIQHLPMHEVIPHWVHAFGLPFVELREFLLAIISNLSRSLYGSMVYQSLLPLLCHQRTC